MSEHGSHRTSDKVAGLVTEILAKHGVGSEVGHDVELAKLGMTSIDMVELMLSVEADFDVTIPPADITLDNFRSISSIQRLIERLCAVDDNAAAA